MVKSAILLKTGGFFMLLVELNKVRKYYGDRLILDIGDLKIYLGDRIGIVGLNGAGKTTLIDILSHRIEPDEGWVKTHGKFEYISQLEAPNYRDISSEMASKFKIANTWNDNMSGGEKTRFKLAQSLSKDSLILFADEPTSNLDIDGIEILEERLLEYNGALIIISHDRDILDQLCNKIIEIENAKIKIYNGNYTEYREQKEQERERALFEYREYVGEKKRLEGVITETSQKSKSIKGTPKRMGNSEARLHKMGGQKAKATLDKKVKNLRKRIEHLEEKEKPLEQKKAKIDLLDSSKLHSKIIIEGKKINKKFDKKIIFKDTEFSIFNGNKIALIGPNGCGKSTLIKMIIDHDPSIKIAHGAKIGYFSQNMSILDDDLSIIENVMSTSVHTENFARLLLARLLFRGNSIYKKVGVLSGGEQVKVSFAKIILQDINLLILDEPTNYLDIDSLEAMESTLKEYDRTLLLVSHDRRFISSIADHIMTIEDYKIHILKGNYDEFLESKNKSGDKEEIQEQIIVLETRLSEVIGKLSIESKKENLEALDKAYYNLLGEIKALKKLL